MFSAHELAVLTYMLENFAYACHIEYEKAVFEYNRGLALYPDDDFSNDEEEIDRCKKYYDQVMEMASLVRRRFHAQTCKEFGIPVLSYDDFDVWF